MKRSITTVLEIQSYFCDTVQKLNLLSKLLVENVTQSILIFFFKGT